MELWLKKIRIFTNSNQNADTLRKIDNLSGIRQIKWKMLTALKLKHDRAVTQKNTHFYKFWPKRRYRSQIRIFKCNLSYTISDAVRGKTKSRMVYSLKTAYSHSLRAQKSAERGAPRSAELTVSMLILHFKGVEGLAHCETGINIYRCTIYRLRSWWSLERCSPRWN